MVYCLFGGELIIYVINKYDCIIVCIRGMLVMSDLVFIIVMLFLDVFEIGILIICGFFFSGFLCFNVCCWCFGNDLIRNLFFFELCLNLFI